MCANGAGIKKTPSQSYYPKRLPRSAPVIKHDVRNTAVAFASLSAYGCIGRAGGRFLRSSPSRVYEDVA